MARMKSTGKAKSQTKKTGKTKKIKKSLGTRKLKYAKNKLFKEARVDAIMGKLTPVPKTKVRQIVKKLASGHDFSRIPPATIDLINKKIFTLAGTHALVGAGILNFAKKKTFTEDLFKSQNNIYRMMEAKEYKSTEINPDIKQIPYRKKRKTPKQKQASSTTNLPQSNIQTVPLPKKTAKTQPPSTKPIPSTTPVVTQREITKVKSTSKSKTKSKPNITPSTSKKSPVAPTDDTKRKKRLVKRKDMVIVVPKSILKKSEEEEKKRKDYDTDTDNERKQAAAEEEVVVPTDVKQNITVADQAVNLISNVVSSTGDAVGKTVEIGRNILESETVQSLKKQAVSISSRLGASAMSRIRDFLGRKKNPEVPKEVNITETTVEVSQGPKAFDSGSAKKIGAGLKLNRFFNSIKKMNLTKKLQASENPVEVVQAIPQQESSIQQISEEKPKIENPADIAGDTNMVEASVEVPST